MENNEEEIIGKRKYDALKQFNFDNLTDETIKGFNVLFPTLTIADAIKKIENYESKRNISIEKEASMKEYLKKIREPKIIKEKPVLTKEILWERFVYYYEQNEGIKYSTKKKDANGNIVTDINSLENIKPLIYYFIGDFENFKQCANLSKLSEPSLDKGILIMGGYGNGKTSVMKALEKAISGLDSNFKLYPANDVVLMYEQCDTPSDKKQFNDRMAKGTRCFDDVLTEREANNFGKANLFKDIIEQRYNNKSITHITCNFQDGTNNDLEIGLKQFGLKYGSRVYDRLFQMFNIIEFKGKSFRK